MDGSGPHAIAILPTGREPLVLGVPHSQCGNSGKAGKFVVLLGTEPQTVLPVAKSLYALTVVSCLCMHWQFQCFCILANLLCHDTITSACCSVWKVERQRVWRVGASRKINSKHNWLNTSIRHSPFRWHGRFWRAIRLAPQESTECIFAVGEGECTQALCCYWTLSCLTHFAHVPCAFIEHSHLTECAHVHCTITDLSCRTERLTPNLSNVFDIKQGLKIPLSPPTELGVTLVLCYPHLTSLSSYCSIRWHLGSLYFNNSCNEIHRQFIQFHHTAVSILPQNWYWLRRRERDCQQEQRL